MENKKSYYDPLYVRKGLKDDEHISPTGRLNQTFGIVNNEENKNEEKPQDSEKSDTRNQSVNRRGIGKKDR
jgi:hypothetical protein